MATVLEMMELYRTMMALLKPLEGAFGGAWQSIGMGGLADISDFFGEYKSRNNSGNIAAAPRKAVGSDGFNDLVGLGAFDKAIGLPVRPERPVRPDNGGFFYTDFGDKSASGRTGRAGERDLNTVSEKIRGGAFVFPEYGADSGIVLDKQLIGKRISGIGGVDLGYLGYFNFSGEYDNSGNSGENRGLLYSRQSRQSHRTFWALEDPENRLVPNARTEEFDLWKNTEYLRMADPFKISGDIASERLSALRGYAEREIGDSGSFGGSEAHIDMPSMKNAVNSKSDMDELIDRLCGAISEAAFSMAEGVHS